MKPFDFLKAGRGVRWTFTVVLAVPLLAVMGYFVVLPVLYFIENEESVGTTADYDSLTTATDGNKRDALLQWRELGLENAAIRAQLQAARLDSIYFYINLIDSIAAIQIKGVTLRQSRLERFYAGPALAHIRQSAEAENWLSRPLMASQEWSSFVKHPFKIKNAPKDTLEALAMKQDIMTPDPIDAYFTILFDRNVLLRMSQIEEPSKKGLWALVAYELAFRYGLMKRNFHNIIQFKAPPHYISIELKLPQSDIIAMFRAVPYTSSMILLF